MNLLNRPRRLRVSPALRGLVRETRISADSLIKPFFVCEGSAVRREITSMPGQYHYSCDTLPSGVEESLKSGVNAVLLFGIPNDENKDELGSSAWAENGVVQRAIQELRRLYPELLIVTDVCMCEYTSHGHCGCLHGDTVDNDKTLPLLAQTALSHVQAGADLVAPSDMMDGRVGYIRMELDKHGFQEKAIMSYAAKYASAFYGPFREAAHSAPQSGDRKGYQMDPHNVKEAVYEATLDIGEGADIIMVKPALSYLDVLHTIAAQSVQPVAAYSVSGEYAMLKAAAEKGFLDEYKAMCESAVSIYRAGASILISYYANEIAQAIQKGDIG